MKITIPGIPVAKKRHRTSIRRGRPHQYNPQRKEEDSFILQVIRRVGRPVMITKPVDMFFAFYMPIPKSTPKRRRAQMICGEICHTKSPDLSNLIKFVEDCFNKYIYYDDSQIVSINATKAYGEQPRTVIYIIER